TDLTAVNVRNATSCSVVPTRHVGTTTTSQETAMSLTSVQAKIKSAMTDHIITKAEAEGIVVEAAKNGVTFREGKAVADLFEAPQPPVAQPGQMMTMMVPEYPGDVTFQDGARSVLQTFLDKNLIPVGESKAAMTHSIKNEMSSIDW